MVSRVSHCFHCISTPLALSPPSLFQKLPSCFLFLHSAGQDYLSNPTAAFTITDPKTGTKLASNFIFDTEDGTISTWSGGLSDIAHAVLAVDNSTVPDATNGAVYKGLAFGTKVTPPCGPRIASDTCVLLRPVRDRRILAVRRPRAAKRVTPACR